MNDKMDEKEKDTIHEPRRLTYEVGHINVNKVLAEFLNCNLFILDKEVDHK